MIAYTARICRSGATRERQCAGAGQCGCGVLIFPDDGWDEL